MAMQCIAPMVLLVVALPAYAQDAAIQRELLRRQQQSDTFTLQLRHSQQSVISQDGPAMHAQHLWDRQRLENLEAQQLQSATQPLSADPEVARQLQPYQRQRAADERLLVLPPPVVMQAPSVGPRDAARGLLVPKGY